MTMWSEYNPYLQRSWDATSLRDFMRDPALYYYKVIEGWTPIIPPAALYWGRYYHEALEVYDREMLRGAGHQQALHYAIEYSRNVAQEAAYGPWGEVWTLDEIAEYGKKSDKSRTLDSLIRSLVWYAEEGYGGPDDVVQVATMPDGEPALEVTFQFPLRVNGETLTTPYGEPYMICGHLDGAVFWDDDFLVRERKHTTSSLSPYYRRKFKPDVQISNYALAGNVVFDQQPKGVMIEATQIGRSFSRFERFSSPRSASEIDEWLYDVGWWIKWAENCAEKGHWPMNQATTDLYGGDVIYEALAHPENVREGILSETHYRLPAEQRWDPTQPR